MCNLEIGFDGCHMFVFSKIPSAGNSTKEGEFFDKLRRNNYQCGTMCRHQRMCSDV